MQADSVEHLRKLLNVASGGVVLTPARPHLVGLRPALCAVYVARRPSLSIHHDAEVYSLPFEDRRQALSYPDAERRDAALGVGGSEGCSIISSGACVFSTPMTEAEVDTLVEAFKSGLAKLASMG